MKNIGYYSFADNNKEGYSKCSAELLYMPLILNCAGYIETDLPFTTNNTRGRLDYYLIYVKSGTLTLIHEGKELAAPAGSLVALEAKKPYKYCYSGGDRLGYFWLHFTGSEVTNRLSEYHISLFPAVHRARRDNHIPQRFQSIFNAYTRGDDFKDRELSALTDRLLITAARAVSADTVSPDSLSKSLKYIAEFYNTDIKIPYLASLEHLSVSRYNFLFKKQMGSSPKRYILELRMSGAADLLLSTDLPIKQISDMCGYPDAQFFAKTFKAYFGVSPTQYRKW